MLISELLPPRIYMTQVKFRKFISHNKHLSQHGVASTQENDVLSSKKHLEYCPTHVVFPVIRRHIKPTSRHFLSSFGNEFEQT